jgi:hypothetical protein
MQQEISKTKDNPVTLKVTTGHVSDVSLKPKQSMTKNVKLVKTLVLVVSLTLDTRYSSLSSSSSSPAFFMNGSD